MADSNETTTLMPFPGRTPRRSLPTADVFAAAINRLNRQSVSALLGQLTEAVNTCAEEMADEVRITQLINERIANYNYTNAIESLVTLISSEISHFDFVNNNTNNFNTYIDGRFNNYDLSNNSTFSTAVDNRINNYDLSNNSTFDSAVTSIFENRIANYNLVNNASFNASIDNRLKNYNLANNKTFETSVDNRVKNYNLANNTTFNTSVDSRLTNYDFSSIFDNRLTNYDFSRSTSFCNYVDARLANYDLSTNTTFNMLVDERLSCFDFTNNTSIINLVDSAVAGLRLDITNINNVLSVHSTNIARNQGDIVAINNNIANIDNRLEQHTTQIASINASLGDIANLTVIQQDIETLRAQLEETKILAGELDGHERDQVIEIIDNILAQQSYAEQIVNNVEIEVNNQSYSLVQLLGVLFSVDAIENVAIQYNEFFIDGCVYTLTDGVNVTFTCQRFEAPDGTLTYEFHTSDWKGLTATFRSKFARIQSPTYQVCKKAVSFDWYEPIGNSNLVFSLIG